MSSTTVYTLRAKHQGEVLAHCRTRTQFLTDVGADPRTLAFFGFLAEHIGADVEVKAAADLLDAAAERAGLPHRSSLRHLEYESHLTPIRGLLEHHEEQRERLLERAAWDTLQTTIGFVVSQLYGTVVDEEVPIRAWLAGDLIDIFRSSLAGQVWGAPVSMTVPLSPTLAAVPKGQRLGKQLERDAHWYYQARVQEPRVTKAQLAREYRDARPDVFNAPKDRNRTGINERAATSVVRGGIANAERLLGLTVPPDQWAKHFQTTLETE